jgi:hypothetical protein
MDSPLPPDAPPVQHGGIISRIFQQTAEAEEARKEAEVKVEEAEEAELLEKTLHEIGVEIERHLVLAKLTERTTFSEPDTADTLKALHSNLGKLAAARAKRYNDEATKLLKLLQSAADRPLP